MKAFLKRHRFKILITVLVVILMYVSFYMLWVHVPYATKQNELNRIQRELCSEYDYEYDDYFNEYYSDSTYYIMKAKNDDGSLYVAFNEDLEELKVFDGKAVSEESVVSSFEERYEVSPTKTEIAYENNSIVYCLTYRGEDTLIYAFFNIEDGEFVKAYRL